MGKYNLIRAAMIILPRKEHIRCTEDCWHFYVVHNDEPEDMPCPVCAEIKAAEDKRGEEVLEFLCERITSRVSLKILPECLRRDYQERFK